jgi:hypothetical protein
MDEKAVDGLCRNCQARPATINWVGSVLCMTCADLFMALHERDQALAERDAAILALNLAKDELAALKAGVPTVDKVRERDAARKLVGRLLFRYAGGLESEPWHCEGDWVAEAEEAARTDWRRRHPPG